jgi:hypothetical protein
MGGNSMEQLPMIERLEVKLTSIKSEDCACVLKFVLGYMGADEKRGDNLDKIEYFTSITEEAIKVLKKAGF